MDILKTSLEGVLIIEPRLFKDDRGHFFESYNEAAFHKAGITNHFVQDNQSKSTYGVIRGLHCQLGEHAQAKLVRVAQGKVLDVIVDIRENSITFGKHIAIELSDENERQVFIPRGFLHGFSVLSETAVFTYKCDNLYHKESESGVRYDDPSINIDWQIPLDKALVSDKDLQLGRIHDVTYNG